MQKHIKKFVLVLFLIAALTSISFAQETGSINGIITDEGGAYLPGAMVSVSSPALMGSQNYISTTSGNFRFPSLPPGTYQVSFALDGFKTVIRKNIIVSVGMTVSLNVKMEQSSIQEEVIVTAPSPMIDIKTTKIGVNVDFEMLQNLPMNRNLGDVINSVPGAVGMDGGTTSVHGASVRGNTYSFDGVNMNDPDQMTSLVPINFDVVDEIEMITGAQPARIGFTEGVYVNVVTKSGGNKFSGQVTTFYTTDTMSKDLWTDEQLQALGKKKPVVDRNWIDGAFSLGGPIIKERLWFFANGRRVHREKRSAFEGPYTDPYTNITWEAFDWYSNNWMGFGKLTGQLTSKLKIMAMFNFTDNFQPSDADPGPYTFLGYTKKIDHDRTYTGNIVVSYILNQNTFLEVRGSYINNYYPALLQDEVADLPYYTDIGTVWPATRAWGSNFVTSKNRALVGAHVTHFADNLFGMSHEIKAGLEYENAKRRYDYWQKDNTVLFFRNGNPYIYGNNRGLFRFFTGGTEEGDTNMIDVANRFGAYIEDSINIKNRLVISFGLRFDHSTAWKPAASLGQAGSDLSLWLGENLLRPYVAAQYPDEFPNGLNPFEAQTLPDWKNIITWNNFSPRIGLTFDVFGDGTTALKASYSRYTEYMMLTYISRIHPYSPKDFVFYWDDDDWDGNPEITDTFTLYPRDPRSMDIKYAQAQIDPDIISPTNDEIIVGVTREIVKNFSVGVNYIYKHKKNIFETVLYDPDTGEEWYNPESPAGQKYWVPFSTIVPGDDDFPDENVDVYYLKNDSPDMFYRATNVPELYRKYRGLEINFNKRMANGWQLSGSVIFSKSTGNIGVGSGDTFGWSSAMDSANWFVNHEGRTSNDRPLAIKLMGTAEIPWGFYLSFYYRHFSGSPWARSAYVNAPAAWLAANQARAMGHSVQLEPLGSRRNESVDSLDLRLEKEISIKGIGRIGAYLDVLNALGRKGINIGVADSGWWYPVAENTLEGNKVTNVSYKQINSLYGQRVFKASLRFSF
jgi:hypothetical protein